MSHHAMPCRAMHRNAVPCHEACWSRCVQVAVKVGGKLLVGYTDECQVRGCTSDLME